MNETAPIEILLVEDDPSHAEISRRNLSVEGVPPNRLVHVADGQQALDYLFGEGSYTKTPPKPNIILLDLRLPRVDGLGVLRRIKASDTLKKIPVVVLTTSAISEDINSAYEAGASSYLVKPIDFTAFLRLMENFRDYWLSWNRYPND